MEWIEINEIKNDKWLREISSSSTVIYTHVFEADEDSEKKAEGLGMSLYDYAVHSKNEQRDTLMEKAMEYDRSAPNMWMVVHSTEEGNKFKKFECMEEILRELFYGQCDIYIEFKGINRIIRDDGVYTIYQFTPTGRMRWEEMLGKRKYDDYMMQITYMIHSMFLYRGMLQSGGRKWYKGVGTGGKKRVKEE